MRGWMRGPRKFPSRRLVRSSSKLSAAFGQATPVRVTPDSNILARANARSAGPARKLILLLASQPGSLILSRYILEEVGRILAPSQAISHSVLRQTEWTLSGTADFKPAAAGDPNKGQ